MIGPGDRIDRYRIESQLGEGGMGRVFRAHDERLDRQVALKVLLSEDDPALRARLQREARAVARLDHPNIVSIYDVGEVEGSPYLAMELVRGRSLRELVGRGELSPSAKVSIMLQVAEALAAAHEAGIVHRDIKPENVILREDGRVKVLDFGIARLERPAGDASAPTQTGFSTLTADGTKIGTPAYMAPEQIRGGELDARCDQFAWGVTAYELFVGGLPFTAGDAMGLIAEILTSEPKPPPESAAMPPHFAQTVRRALRKTPDNRFSSMRELIASLGVEGSAQPGHGPSSPRAPYVPVSTPPARPPSHAPSAPPPSFNLSRGYSTQEMTEIFDLALRRQRDRYQYEDVVEAGREIGLEEVALRDAMGRLVARGVVPQSAEGRERVLRQLKRQGATWAVLACFFLLLDMLSSPHTWFSSPHTWWFQYPVLAIGLVVGIRAVRLYFPQPDEKPAARVDAMMSYDAQRMSEYLAARPRLPTPVPVRIAVPSENESEIRREAEAEVEALVGSPSPARIEQREP